MYEVDYSMVVTEYGVLTIADAIDADDAEEQAVRKLQRDFPEASDISIELVKDLSK
jgi:hypothetical protein